MDVATVTQKFEMNIFFVFWCFETSCDKQGDGTVEIHAHWLTFSELDNPRFWHLEWPELKFYPYDPKLYPSFYHLWFVACFVNTYHDLIG